MLIVDFLVFSQRGDQSAELSGCLIIWSCLGIQTDAARSVSKGERQGQQGRLREEGRASGNLPITVTLPESQFRFDISPLRIIVPTPGPATSMLQCSSTKHGTKPLPRTP